MRRQAMHPGMKLSEQSKQALMWLNSMFRGRNPHACAHESHRNMSARAKEGNMTVEQ